jgi:hypothetical protein
MYCIYFYMGNGRRIRGYGIQRDIASSDEEDLRRTTILAIGVELAIAMLRFNKIFLKLVFKWNSRF